MTASSLRDLELRAQECRDLIRHIELAARFVNQVFELEGVEVPYGVLIHELGKATGSTSCRMMLFVDWLEICKFVELVDRDEFLRARVRLNINR